MTLIDMKRETRLSKAQAALPKLTNFSTMTREHALVWPLASDESLVKTSLLKVLLRLALENVQLDERYYLRSYPDVVEAMEKGKFASPQHHYVEFGYFEDRMPFKIEVDEDFYFRTNPDIEAVVNGGLIPSAQVHFERHGYKEGRLPSEGWSLLASR
jgi:hypothetical protein